MSITKIAAITGASVSTVARVLRDPEHKCHSMELKEKIQRSSKGSEKRQCSEQDISYQHLADPRQLR